MKAILPLLLWSWCSELVVGDAAQNLIGSEANVVNDLLAKNLRQRKKRGILKKREVSLASVLFPRVAPVEYPTGQEMSMYIDLVTSRQSNVPFEYYKLGVCPPIAAGRKMKKNLGEKLKGHSVSRPAPYQLNVERDLGCQTLCQVEIDQKKIDRFIRLTRQRYRVNLSLDGLPVYVQQNSELNIINKGYPIGARLKDGDGTNFYLHNHLRFTIHFHQDRTNFNGNRIVGFEVKPVSIQHETNSETPSTCTPETIGISNKLNSLVKLEIPINEDSLKIIYSYEVAWQESGTTWADRWDIYIDACVDESSLHHARVINSLFVFVALLVTATLTFVGMLRKDYKDIIFDGEPTDDDDKGWKLLHADVFRPPSYSPLALSVLIGNGAQIMIIVICTFILISFRVINPMKKGQALGAIFMLYILSGGVCGYVSARLFKVFGGNNWKMSTIWSAATLPGFLMTLFLILNIMLTAAGAANSVSIWTILLIFILWTCMSLPLVFLGSYLGFKGEKISVPTKTNQIARVVPEQIRLGDSLFGSFLIGLTAFSTITVEIYMIMSTIWLEGFSYAVGYFCFVITIFAVSCALLTMMTCYYRMNRENHRWWWYAFADTASSGVCLFVYSGWFVAHQVNYSEGLPFIVYWTYMTMLSVLLALFAGAAGFLPTFFFVRNIFSIVKVD